MRAVWLVAPQRQIEAIVRRRRQSVLSHRVFRLDQEAQAAHLKEVFHDIAPGLIDAAIADETAFSRDDLVYAARVARAQVISSLYDVQRKRIKPEWASSGMPNNPPPIGEFVPANGMQLVAFQYSNGKKLVDGLRQRVHCQARGSTQAIDSKVYTVTQHLRTVDWSQAFTP